ncbi:hypothetical protein GE061_008125 [Apolygus lucorum]|uniref:Ste24 endopeptidase n=1 Tax=Apolygus lucorum TaxID=248454 RepID=A0A8S9WNX9_APOLU|nr:hypothetical protein GE061_008125 [Apolygus lucorum]
MDHRFQAFLGITGLAYFWKMYILTRNLINVSFMAAPPDDMKNLKKPATWENLRIQDPFPSKGMDDSLAARMCETENCDGEGSVFAALRTATIQRDMTELYVMVYNFGVSMIKLSTGYYPALWLRTSWASENLSVRAAYFFSVDNFITASWLVPLYVTTSAISKHAELGAKLHMGFFKQSMKASLVIQLVNGFSFLPEKVRNFGWIMVASGVYSAVLVIPMTVILTLKQTFPRARDDHIGKNLKRFAETVGFPPSDIFVGPRVDYPEAKYSNVLSRQMLFYNTLLTDLCSTPEQVIAVVGHEIGRRNVYYCFFKEVSYFIELFGLSYICMKTLENPVLYNLFGFEVWNDVHPNILLYLSCIHIWPILTEVASCCRSWVLYELELLADDFVCSVGYPLSLMMGILTLAGTSSQYPIFDDPWYASYCLGVPTVQERLERIEERLGIE